MGASMKGKRRVNFTCSLSTLISLIMPNSTKLRSDSGCITPSKAFLTSSTVINGFSSPRLYVRKQNGAPS